MPSTSVQNDDSSNSSIGEKSQLPCWTVCAKPYASNLVALVPPHPGGVIDVVWEFPTEVMHPDTGKCASAALRKEVLSLPAVQQWVAAVRSSAGAVPSLITPFPLTDPHPHPLSPVTAMLPPQPPPNWADELEEALALPLTPSTPVPPSVSPTSASALCFPSLDCEECVDDSDSNLMLDISVSVQ